MTPFERSARFWLRAYPRRWRVLRTDEVVAVLADVAPDVDRVGARAAVGLLRHGWVERWRGRPPAWQWIGYRFFRVTLDPEYRQWMQDDIDGALFPWRAN